MKLKNILSKTIVSLLAAMAIGTTSCNYLDIVPPEQVGVNDAMENRDNALGFLYSCYNPMTSTARGELPYYYYLSDLVFANDDILNPHTWATDGGDNGVAGLILLNTLSASRNNNVWSHYYKGIGQALLFLDKMNECNIVGRGIIDESEAIEWRAEAKALIAYYHFLLLRRYGPIVICDSRTSLGTPTTGYKGRYHFDYCVDWIADQLDEAAKDLPASRITAENGRMTSTICKAIKAQMYLIAASPLWNGKFPYIDFKNNNFETPGYGMELVSRTYDESKWQRAYNAADEAIKFAESQGGNSIYTGNYLEEQTGISLDHYWLPGNVDDDFKRSVLRMKSLFCTGKGEGNNEAIWDMIVDQSYYAGTMWLHNPAFPANMMKTGSTVQSGNGALNPTINAITHFLTKDGYLPENDPNFTPEANWYKSAGLPSEGLRRDMVINLNVNREPRFYAWIGFDGGDYMLKMIKGSPVHLNLMQNHNPSNPKDLIGYHGYQASQRDNGCTGYLYQKHQPATIEINENGGGYIGFTEQAIKIIRLSELYLIRAECAAQLNNTKQALDDVNVIRSRAGVPDLTEKMIGAGGMSLLDWVLNERRIEFFAESHRYFDIRRYLDGEKYLGYGKRMGLNVLEKENPTFEEFNKPIALPYPYTWGNKLYLYPIPQAEVYANPQCVQNPGY